MLPGSPLTGPLGGPQFGGNPHGLVIRVGGVDVWQKYKPRSLTVRDSLAQRNTAQLELVDLELGGWAPGLGEELEVYHGVTRLFRGTVDEVGLADTITRRAVTVTIRAVDFNQLADRHVISANYETPGQTLRDIVIDIVENQADGGLAGEGITTELVAEGPEITTARFDYRSARAAFDDLAKRTGYLWWIDDLKRLVFVDRSTYTAPFDFGKSGDYLHRSMSRTLARRKYRNRQIVRGGYQRTDPQTETFTGDGDNRNFTLRFDIAELNPTEPVVSVNSVPKTVGIQGKEEQEDADYFYAPGSNTLSQSSEATQLTSSDTLSVTYVGQFPVVVIEDVEEEIAARAAVEGGTGIYTIADRDQDLQTLDLAVDRSQELLRRFGILPDRIQVTTQEAPGLEAGQIVLAREPILGVDSEYLIEQITIQDRGGSPEVLEYRVDGTSGEDYGGWVEFFRRVVESGQDIEIGEGSTITIARRKVDTVQLADAASNSFVLNDLHQIEDDPYTAARVDLVDWTMEGDLAPAAVVGFAKVGDHPRTGIAEDVGILAPAPAVLGLTAGEIGVSA